VFPVTPTSVALAVTNTATVSGGGDPGCPAATRCASSVEVLGSVGPFVVVEFNLTKTAAPSTFRPGQPASYTLTVRNGGVLTTTAPAIVIDELPEGVTLTSTPAACTTLAQLVTCVVAAGLGPGASVSFVLPILVDQSVAAGTVLRNVAVVFGDDDSGCPAEERCNAVLDVEIPAAIPVTSTAMFLAIAALLLTFALWRLRPTSRS
jgi:large repetitive protein